MELIQYLFCLRNKIKLIYSATFVSLGNKGKDKNLSTYAFTKSNIRIFRKFETLVQI